MVRNPGQLYQPPVSPQLTVRNYVHNAPYLGFEVFNGSSTPHSHGAESAPQPTRAPRLMYGRMDAGLLPHRRPSLMEGGNAGEVSAVMRGQQVRPARRGCSV